VLTIAHRLDTVVGAMSTDVAQEGPAGERVTPGDAATGSEEPKRGSDRILVLDAGEVKEFGAPEELLLATDSPASPGGAGWLRQMVLQSGEAGERAIRHIEQTAAAM